VAREAFAVTGSPGCRGGTERGCSTIAQRVSPAATGKSWRCCGLHGFVDASAGSHLYPTGVIVTDSGNLPFLAVDRTQSPHERTHNRHCGVLWSTDNARRQLILE
jgi:hypothetical protein